MVQPDHALEEEEVAGELLRSLALVEGVEERYCWAAEVVVEEHAILEVATGAEGEHCSSVAVVEEAGRYSKTVVVEEVEHYSKEAKEEQLARKLLKVEAEAVMALAVRTISMGVMVVVSRVPK